MYGGEGRDGFLKFRERDFFVSAGVTGSLRRESSIKTNEKQFNPSEVVDKLGLIDVTDGLWNRRLLYLNFWILEFFASMVLMFSGIYVPEYESDFLRQFVSSAAIVAVIVGMKDRRYFCPDGTCMVTLVMIASGAYNDATGYHFAEIACRLFGQALGFIAIYYGFASTNVPFMKEGTLSFSHQSLNINDTSLSKIHEVNRSFCEAVGTFVEGIAVSFALMPLLRVRSQRENIGLMTDRSVAKSEALPPRTKDLWYAAICLGLVHYVLERVFRAAMNPCITLMHAMLENNGDVYYRLIGQAVGLLFACLYCFNFRPNLEVYRWLAEGGK
jgi:glycerol uptake facilitator-like aquaporin